MRKIVMCFPFIGTTYVAEKYGWIDYTHTDDILGLANEIDTDPLGPPILIPFPTSGTENYINFLKENMIPWILVHPLKGAREEYIARMSSVVFGTHITSNWDKWIAAAYAEERCESTIVLEKGQYLEDVRDQIIGWEKKNVNTIPSNCIITKSCVHAMQPTASLKIVKDNSRMMGLMVNDRTKLNTYSDSFTLMQLHKCVLCEYSEWKPVDIVES